MDGGWHSMELGAELAQHGAGLGEKLAQCGAELGAELAQHTLAAAGRKDGLHLGAGLEVVVFRFLCFRGGGAFCGAFWADGSSHG